MGKHGITSPDASFSKKGHSHGALSSLDTSLPREGSEGDGDEEGEGEGERDEGRR